MRRLSWLILAVLIPVAAWAQAVPYAVRLSGADGLDFRARLEEASRLLKLADEPPSSLISLRRRAEGDVERLGEVLRSEGHYGGTVAFSIDETHQPVAVELTVDAGPRFRLDAFEVRMDIEAGAPQPAPVPLADLDLALGQPARAESVVKAQASLLHALAEQGYPLARVGDRQVVVDHATQSMRVEVVVEAGPLCRFDDVTVEGLERVEENWVRRRVPWEKGEKFSLEQMETLRRRLVDSRLFSSVRLSTGREAGPDGRLPVSIQLAEADRRSIGAGVSWASTEGFGGNAYWEHRNLLGGAERLRAALTASEIRTAADLSLRVPDALGTDRDFLSALTAEEQRAEAYTTRTLGGSAGLEWAVSPTWRLAASGALERTFEERDNQTRQYTLVSFPLEARQDNSDDILDPSRGNRLRVQVRPFVEELGSSVGFTRFDLYDSHYVQLSSDPRVILAGWAQFGTIAGAGLDSIPSDKRFYVGGGGSVRAFGYQMAGPVNDAGDPTGGLSALAFGGEIRFKLTDEIGVVPFIEAGNAYQTRWPRPGQGLRWGGGLGLRYDTPVGPARADFAVPFNPRSGVDDSFQILLSLGQAF